MALRYVNSMQISGPWKDGPYPIKPCEACPVRWLHCDLSKFGGGWNLVYESVGVPSGGPHYDVGYFQSPAARAMGGPSSQDLDELFTGSFQVRQYVRPHPMLC